MEQFILRYSENGLWYGTFTHFDRLGIKHGISTRLGGTSNQPFSSLNLGLHNGDQEEQVICNRQLFCQGLGVSAEKVVTAQQVHGDRIVVVTKEHIGRGATRYEEAIADTDALITNIPDIPLLLFFADCVPVLIVDPVHQVIGIAHAGWKGTVDLIGQKTLLAMQKHFGTNPEECLAAIAPSVGPCCYEVDDIVIRKLQEPFKNWGTLITQKDDKKYLDLWEANRQQLEQVGMKHSNIVVSKICTSCNKELFFSYRAESGCTGRIGAMIVL